MRKFATSFKARPRHLFQAALAYGFYYFFKILPLDMASGLGGKILRMTGPYLRASKTARKSLSIAMPHLSRDESERIIRGMWENLGRTLGEFPHIPRLTGEQFDKRVTIVNEDIVHQLKAEGGKGLIIFSGHFANWEIAPKSAYERATPLCVVYRPPNNPYIDRLIRASRRKSHSGLYAKGAESARKVIEVLKSNLFVGMLVDQKMNNGVQVRFFDTEVMAPRAMADMALKFGCPLIPVRVIRERGAYFTVEVNPPLDIRHTGSKEADAIYIMQQAYDYFERWILEHPDQWLWLHRRWPKERYKDL